MTGTVWVGVDPGRNTTGIIARHAANVLATCLVERQQDEWPGHGIGPTYLHLVVDEITRIRGEAAARTEGQVRVAVEGMNVPTGFTKGRQQFARPVDLIGASLVLGAILAAFPHATVVRPGGNGGGRLGSYPLRLVSEGEQRLGLDRTAGQSSSLRHLRSAWDVSLVAERTPQPVGGVW